MTPASIRTGSNAEPRPSTSIGSSPSKRFTKSTSCGASYAVGPDTDGLNRKPHHTSQRASEKKKGGNREQAPWPTHADVSSSTRALSLLDRDRVKEKRCETETEMKKRKREKERERERKREKGVGGG